MLTKAFFADVLDELIADDPGNRAEVPGQGSIQLFDAPLIGVADAHDPLFNRFRDPDIIGDAFLAPCEWIPEAQSVISFFFPFTEALRRSNRGSSAWPSLAWAYGRYEGQTFIVACLEALKQRLAEEGVNAVIPTRDPRFTVRIVPVAALAEDGESPDSPETTEGGDFRANSAWSERHVAYACGLGTFGLSRGFITERGMAGRLGSIIVDCALPPDARPCDDPMAYCIRCGACVRNCPAHAISLEHGKSNRLCNAYLDTTREHFAPRYGCGKCQVDVPCESRRP